MSISLKVYNKIDYTDVRQGMALRIVTDGPRIKSDVEGIVSFIYQGRRWGNGPSFASDGLPRVSFKNDSAASHIVKYPEYGEDTTVELYEVIDAIPDEPKGVGAVVRVVDLCHPERNMEAVKTWLEAPWIWVSNDVGSTWDSITRCVLSLDYDYIEVLREGVYL